MLALYRDKARTREVLRQALKLSEEEFDRAFMEYVGSKARPLQEGLGGAAASDASKLSKEEVLGLLAARDTFPLRLRAGQLLREEGDSEGAIKHLRRAAELFPQFAGEGNPYEALADIYEKRGDAAAAAEALDEFRSALALRPANEAEAHYNVARAYHALGKTAEAKRSVLRALEAAPSYEKAQELLLT